VALSENHSFGFIGLADESTARHASRRRVRGSTSAPTSADERSSQTTGPTAASGGSVQPGCARLTGNRDLRVTSSGDTDIACDAKRSGCDARSPQSVEEACGMRPGTRLWTTRRNTVGERSVRMNGKRRWAHPPVGPRSSGKRMSILFRPLFAPKLRFSAAILEASR